MDLLLKEYAFVVVFIIIFIGVINLTYKHKKMSMMDILFLHKL